MIGGKCLKQLSLNLVSENQNCRLGNACSIQLSYVVSSALIKYTATPFRATLSKQFTDFYRDLPRFPEIHLGKPREKMGVADALV